jgi:hypothetical protein
MDDSDHHIHQSSLGYAGWLAILIAVAIIAVIALGVLIHFQGQPLFMVPG